MDRGIVGLWNRGFVLAQHHLSESPSLPPRRRAWQRGWQFDYRTRQVSQSRQGDEAKQVEQYSTQYLSLLPGRFWWSQSIYNLYSREDVLSECRSGFNSNINCLKRRFDERNEQTGSWDNQGCYRCGEIGHRIRQCPRSVGEGVNGRDVLDRLEPPSYADVVRHYSGTTETNR